MSYKAKSDLPDNVRNVLPVHALEIYKEAFAAISGLLGTNAQYFFSGAGVA